MGLECGNYCQRIVSFYLFYTTTYSLFWSIRDLQRESHYGKSFQKNNAVQNPLWTKACPPANILQLRSLIYTGSDLNYTELKSRYKTWVQAEKRWAFSLWEQEKPCESKQTVHTILHGFYHSSLHSRCFLLGALAKWNTGTWQSWVWDLQCLSPFLNKMLWAKSCIPGKVACWPEKQP